MNRPDHPTTTTASSVLSTERLARLGGFLELDPENLVLLRDYASEALRCGESDAAQQAVARLFKAMTSEPGEHVAVAALLRRQGRADAAVPELREALSRWPDESSLANELARCLFSSHDFDLALEALPLASPSDAGLAEEACALRVKLLHHLGRLDEAETAAAACRSVLEAPKVIAALLPVLVDLSRLDEAAQLAGELSSDEATAPYEVAEPLALAALDAEQPEAALQWTSRALRTRSDDGRIWLAKGLAHLQAGDIGLSVEALEQAVKLMPGHSGSHLAHGWAWLLQGDRAKARQAFEAGIDAGPSFAEAYGSLAVLDAFDAKPEVARAGIRKAQLLDEQCASASFATLLLKQAGGHDVAQLAKRVLARARTPAASR